MEENKIPNATMMRKLARQTYELWQYAGQMGRDARYQQIKYTKNREFAIMPPSWIPESKSEGKTIRKLHTHSVQNIEWYIINKCMPLDIPFSLYYSLATYRGGFPRKPVEQSYVEWSIELGYRLPSLVESYDWLIDIDSDAHEHVHIAKMVTKNIMTHLDRFGITYEVRFSGNGFHIVVPYSEFSFLGYKIDARNRKEGENLYSFLHDLTSRFNQLYGEMVDQSIYDSRRLCKLPFSAVAYEDGVFVAFPFSTSEQFENFKVEDANVLNNPDVIYHTKVFNSDKTSDFKGLVESLLVKHGEA